MNLDEIAEITAADVASATELESQARAMRRLAICVGEAIDAVRVARQTLTEAVPAGEGREQVERVFAGVSASTTVERLAGLAEDGASGHGQVVQQPAVLSEVSAQAFQVHTEVEALIAERDAALATLAANPADPGLTSRFGSANPSGMQDSIDLDYGSAGMQDSINLHYDEKGRELFGGATEQYSTAADRLQPVGPVQHGGTGTPAPHRMQPDTDVRLQEQSWSTSKSVGLGPTLQGGSWSQQVTVGNTPGGNHVLRPDVVPHANADGARPPAFRPPMPGIPYGSPAVAPRPVVPPPAIRFVPNGPVTSPVIGARGTGQAPMMAPRPGFAGNRGVLPPTIGARHGQPGPTGGTPNPPAATRAPVQPGVRSRIRPPVVAAGRVVPSRRVGARLTVPPTASRFDRSPRTRHGGDDRPNRAVVKNSRVPRRPLPNQSEAAQPHATQPHTTQPHSDWLPETPTAPPVIRGANRRQPSPPYFGDDTGPVISRYTFGQDR